MYGCRVVWHIVSPDFLMPMEPVGSFRLMGVVVLWVVFVCRSSSLEIRDDLNAMATRRDRLRPPESEGLNRWGASQCPDGLSQVSNRRTPRVPRVVVDVNLSR